MSEGDLFTPHRAKCGCFWWLDRETEKLNYEPCSSSCRLFLYALAKAREEGKDVIEIDLGE